MIETKLEFQWKYIRLEGETVNNDRRQTGKKPKLQNVTPKKATAITLMLDQMVKTKAWKMQGLTACDKCRIRGKQKETMKHLLAVCKVMANSEYLA